MHNFLMEISQAKDFKRFIVGAPMNNDLSHPFLIGVHYNYASSIYLNELIA